MTSHVEYYHRIFGVISKYITVSKGTVSKGADSADFALVNMVQHSDIVITQDYGLAAMCLARNDVPISQNGIIFSDDNIDALLFARHTAKKVRNSGGRIKGASKRAA